MLNFGVILTRLQNEKKILMSRNHVFLGIPKNKYIFHQYFFNYLAAHGKLSAMTGWQPN